MYEKYVRPHTFQMHVCHVTVAPTHLVQFCNNYLVWIPIRVKDDDSVSRLQVQTQSSSSSAQQKHKVIRTRIVKLAQKFTPVFCLCGAIQTQIDKPTPAKVVLHNGHQLRHLTEKQYTMTGCLQLWQNAIKQLKFSWCSVQIWPGKEWHISNKRLNADSYMFSPITLDAKYIWSWTISQ